ncbi:Pvc16 family protein [Tenacibaculum sp. MAR_2009_124]|uniref:Pvc16 family protein n=1 Tax=Tenacibaculum sp. MAR_2009_124 TaxID=1250059 RepID=UPI000B87AC52|nr:Pvc16 family protein [Tenacibaculum sp. MAR_2009_124]
MIASALRYTKLTFDQFLKSNFGLNDSIVALDRIIDQNGAVPLEVKNKVVLTLIHVEQETVKPFYSRNRSLDNGKFEHTSSEEKYNLFLLVSSCFDDYEETLKFLDSSIQFFQTYGTIDKSVNSLIPEGIKKLEFEFQTGNDYLQMHNLWSALGAKYQPSVIYKMKLITIGGKEIKEFISGVNQSSNTIV